MSNLPWLKLYTEARTDRKLACLTRAEKGVWIDLLMYAADQDERGTFDASDRYTLAMEVADGDEELLNSTIDKLLKVRHITCYGQDVTSETSGNGRNDNVTTGNSLHRYIFRTFAARQAQKVSNFPSDAKDRVNERVRKHRDLKRQTKLQNPPPESVTSETSGNDTDRDIERDINISSFAPNVTPMIARPSRRETATASRKQENPLWDVLVEAFYDPQSKAEKSNFGKIVRQLKEMGATPDDVRARVKRHGETCDWDLTPNALMSHWTELGRASNPSRPRASQNGHYAAAVPDIPSGIARLISE